jgi:hypothetical protein
VEEKIASTKDQVVEIIAKIAEALEVVFLVIETAQNLKM